LSKKRQGFSLKGVTSPPQQTQTMTTIALEGMQFFAFHGYYEEEQKTGTQFVVDVYVQIPDASLSMVAKTDELTGTVNYEIIYEICRIEMKKTARLIETVAKRIHDRLKSQFPFAMKVEVRLSKLSPPLDGPVARSFIFIG
jgi:dihydroneopterin aldolase